MTNTLLSDIGAADPTTEAFWQACKQERLLVQLCTNCGARQLYPRPFCLGCEGRDLAWVESPGRGTVYSVTTIRIPVIEELPPPYQLALVDLDQGARLLTNIQGTHVLIGARVRLAWRRREGLPPLPVFEADQ